MKKKILLFFLLIFTLLLCGCGGSESAKPVPASDASAKFQSLTQQFFHEYMTNNTVNMHAMLQNPSDYGITDYEVTLGDFSLGGFRSMNSQLCNSLDKLKQIDFGQLDSEEQFTYQILQSRLTDTLTYCDYYLLDEYLSASDGQQQLLPVYLAEYSFSTEQDILDYLKILQLSETFFDSLLEFETYKAEHGTFMNEFQAEDVILQCKEFLEDKEQHYLISTFQKRIESLELPQEKQTYYIQKNRQYLDTYFFPSYEKIAAVMEQLKSSSQNPGGMCHYENGKLYYEGLVRSKTGSAKSVTQIQQMLENALANDLSCIHQISLENADIEKHLSDFSDDYTSLFDTDLTRLGQNITRQLYQDISLYFPTPAVKSDDVEIHMVPSVMETYEAPAYYLSPPMDCITRNNIYINRKHYKDASAAQLIPVLAHEGFPGHLYQITYFRNTQPDPVRNLQSYPGYAEGWATYAELFSYQIAGLDDPAAQYQSRFTSFSLELYSLIDIYVNYHGQTLEQLLKYGEKWGIDAPACIRIYHAVIDSPATYLQYSVGYLEIEELRDFAMQQLGDRFSLIDFHDFLLKTGPAPFELIHSRMQDQISQLLK